jgi:GTP-binding protein HflX
MLVAAFRATLEEVIEADVVLHVRDVSHGDSEAQAGDVAAILGELGIDVETDQRLIEVWNKIDLLDESRRSQLLEIASRRPPASRPAAVSALSGEGMDELLAAIEMRLASGRPSLTVRVDPADGAGLHWLYRHAEVLDRASAPDGAVVLRVRVAPEREEGIRRRFGRAGAA